jgi:hypothetical protein
MEPSCSILNSAFLEMFPKEDWRNSCTHLGKRTSYLLARLGGGEHVLISLAARNRIEATSRSYDRDCSTLKEMHASKNLSISHLVDTWISWMEVFFEAKNFLVNDGAEDEAIKMKMKNLLSLIPAALKDFNCFESDVCCRC